MPNGQQLLNDLEGNAPIFGIAYSIINASGVKKGLTFNPSSWLKTAGKMIEDGHAIAFLITSKHIYKTGMGEDAWVISESPLKSRKKYDQWARATPNCNTDVYYYRCTEKDVEKFREIKNKLEKEKVFYSVAKPNIPYLSRYENCVSSTHRIVHEMGFGYAIATKGVWIPSVSNNFTWLATKFSAWSHKRFPGVNTHIP